MGKRSQRKGADGERELAAILREYGYTVERGGSMSFGEVPDLVGLPGVHIEVKRCEQVRLSEWMQQAETDRKRFSDGTTALHGQPLCLRHTETLVVIIGQLTVLSGIIRRPVAGVVAVLAAFDAD